MIRRTALILVLLATLTACSGEEPTASSSPKASPSTSKPGLDSALLEGFNDFPEGTRIADPRAVKESVLGGACGQELTSFRALLLKEPSALRRVFVRQESKTFEVLLHPGPTKALGAFKTFTKIVNDCKDVNLSLDGSTTSLRVGKLFYAPLNAEEAAFKAVTGPGPKNFAIGELLLRYKGSIIWFTAEEPFLQDVGLDIATGNAFGAVVRANLD